MRSPEAEATKACDVAWNMVELKPAEKSITAKEKKESACPNRLINVAVIAGAMMTKYLAPILSARKPIKGLKIEGSLEKVVSTPADVNERDKLSIRVGRRGAKNEVYRS